MRRFWLALPVLALVPALFAQDQPKKAVESPLKRAVAEPASEKFELPGNGIAWKKGLDAALDQGRPILLFQLLGNFDDVYC